MCITSRIQVEYMLLVRRHQLCGLFCLTPPIICKIYGRVLFYSHAINRNYIKGSCTSETCLRTTLKEEDIQSATPDIRFFKKFDKPEYSKIKDKYYYSQAIEG